MPDTSKHNFWGRLKGYAFKEISFRDLGFYSRGDRFTDLLGEKDIFAREGEDQTPAAPLPEREPREFFHEDKDNLVLVDQGITFTKDSRNNACQIWGEDRENIIPVKKGRKGLKQILEKMAKDSGRLFTSIIICVHPEDYQLIRCSSDPESTRVYDDALEEITLLNQWAREDFLERGKKRAKILIPNRDFHMRIFPFNYEKLKNAFLVVLKENTFIVDRGDEDKEEILADITVNWDGKSIKKPFYAGKHRFLMGPSAFDDVTIPELPDGIHPAFTYQRGVFRLEYPVIEFSGMETCGDQDQSIRIMTRRNGETWLIESESIPDGIRGKILLRSGEENKDKEIAHVLLTLHKSALEPDKEVVEEGPEYEVVVPDRDLPSDSDSGEVLIKGGESTELDESLKGVSVDRKTRMVQRPPAVKTGEYQMVGKTRYLHLPRPGKTFRSLTRTHRLLPRASFLRTDDTGRNIYQKYSAFFGGEGDWVMGPEDNARLKIEWDGEVIILTPVVANLLLNGEGWQKDSPMTLETDFDVVQIKEENSMFSLNMDCTTLPLMTFPDGEKDFYHLARLNTEPDLIVPLTPDLEFVILGRGEGCTINTGLDDLISQKQKEMERAVQRDLERIEKLNELKATFSFANMMSHRYHALFDHETGTVLNLMELPVFVFEADDDGKLKQREEIRGLHFSQLCENCQKIKQWLDDLEGQPSDRFLDYARSRILSKDGFINCDVCNEKRKEMHCYGDLNPGEYLIVGNAMYLFQERS